jgi:hypothetical protein
MEMTINQLILREQNYQDFEGGMYLFDYKPNLKGCKFVPIPYNLKFVPSYGESFEFRTTNYVLKNQHDYKRMKSIYRLMYLIGGVMK